MKLFTRSTYFKVRGKVENYSRFFVKRKPEGLFITVLKVFPAENHAAVKAGYLFSPTLKFQKCSVEHFDYMLKDMRTSQKQFWTEVDASTFNRLITAEQEAKIAMKRKKRF